jgi:hypothetical protein
MNISVKAAAVLALVATMTANPAHACWTNAERDAAQVANLNMMMMVTALRCRKGSDNFLGEYNQFVKSNNPVLGAQNVAVRSYFVRMNGTRGADSAMDKYVISLANSYGSGHDSKGCGQLKEIAGQLANKKQTAASLLAIAEANVDQHPLPGGMCRANITAK